MKCTGCRLCFKTTNKNDFVVLEEAHRNMLQILIPVINWNNVIYGKNKMCRKCSENLQMTTAFKSSCLDTNKKKRIFEELCETLGETTGMSQTCCLCCQRTVVEATAGGAEVNLKEMICRCFPQMSLPSSDDLGSCEKCLNSLKDLNSFISSCLETEETVSNHCSSMDISRKAFNMDEYIKQNPSIISSDIESESGDAPLSPNSEETGTTALENSNSENVQETNGNSNDSPNNGIESENAVISSTSEVTPALQNNSNSENSEEQNRMDLQEEANAHQDTNDSEQNTIGQVELTGSSSDQRNELENRDSQFLDKLQCDKCDYVAKYKSALKSHMVRHKDPAKTRMHKCDECGHETKRIADLRWHMIIHKDPEEVKTYQCADCPYITKRKADLKQHVIIHNKRNFKCALCSFETKNKLYLDSVHMLLHKDKSQLKTYKCKSCPYETILKCRLRLHCRIHKDPSAIKRFKCNWCDFETIHRQSIKAHQAVHSGSEELKIFKCDFCDYKVRYKSDLKKHMVRHIDTSVTFDCSKCSYKGKTEKRLRKHMEVHRDPSEIKMYKCDMCTYQGKCKGSLKSHIYTHIKKLQALGNKEEEIEKLMSKIHNKAR